MSSAPLGDRIRQSLNDVVQFATEVHEYVVVRGEEHLYADRPTQLVAEALLHRIGEAVSRLPEDFVESHPEVAWRQMKGMRNVIAHQYGFVDYRIVWRALETALPRDVEQITRLLED
jgi:uncharacterized protein with HEPN domain